MTYNSEYQHKYYQRNKEKILKRARKNYLDNKQKLCRYTNQWYKNHPDKAAAYNKKHRKKLREEIINFYGNCCVYCGENRQEVLVVISKNTNKKLSWGECRLYAWIKRNNFPNEFQVVCYNCKFFRLHSDT